MENKTKSVKIKPLLALFSTNDNEVSNTTSNITTNTSPEASVSSSRSNISPINYVFPQPGQGLGPVGIWAGDADAFANRDTLMRATGGAPENVRKFTIPPQTAEDLDTTEQIVCVDKADANGNLFGYAGTLYNQNREPIAVKNVAYVPGDNHRHNNPVQRSYHYTSLITQTDSNIQKLIADGTAYDTQGNNTAEMEQLQYNKFYYAAKKRESWGFHNSEVHHTLLQMKLRDVNNRLTTPAERGNISHTNHFPGTEPTPRNS